jgi:small-conductance mechanosensitive channel
MKVTDSFPVILQNPSSRVLVSEMQDDWVLLTLQFWVSAEEWFYQTKSNVTETLNLAFEQAWITIKKKKLELKQVTEFAKK